jgi:hypothetical protein
VGVSKDRIVDSREVDERGIIVFLNDTHSSIFLTIPESIMGFDIHLLHIQIQNYKANLTEHTTPCVDYNFLRLRSI